MNTNAFKIVYNEDIDYANKDYMSLMIIREFEKFSVEVISSKKSHGRIYLNSKDDATKLFDALLLKIKRINSFHKSAAMLEILKKSKTLNQAMFVLKVFGKNLDQDKIGRLMSSCDFKVKSRINKDDSMKIRVYFSGEKESFGSFKGNFLESNSIFEKTWF